MLGTFAAAIFPRVHPDAFATNTAAPIEGSALRQERQHHTERNGALLARLLAFRRSRIAQLGCVVSLTVVIVFTLGGSLVSARPSDLRSREAARSPAGASPDQAAADAGCPEPSPSYDGPCGPLFTTPQWGVTWALPSEYETIQLAKLDGPGEDLIGRDTNGLWVEKFDQSKGQWELVGNAEGGLALDLAGYGGWNRPIYYRTIQTADLNGDGHTELLARAGDGLHVYRWDSSTHTFVDISKAPRLFSRSADDTLSVTDTIQTADLFGDGHAEVLGRTRQGIEYARWNSNTGLFQDVTQTGIAPDAHGGANPSLYLSIQTGDVAGDGKADLLLLAVGLRRYVREPNGRYREQSVFPALGEQQGFGRPSQYETVHAVRMAG
ncbi:MAG: VCBS repeat-containing protein, partial [Solirubrobacterales bacterium]|nr:VCBS repeat-containing protein [Solirubrobacterales bacterium]